MSSNGDECGTLLEHVPTGQEELAKQYDESTWIEEANHIYCARPVWEESENNRCIWHAEVDDKPLHTLQNSRSDEPEILNWAYLHGVEFGDRLSFAECRLFNADLSNTVFVGADLSGADLRDANLTDAVARSTDFSDADLRLALLVRTDIRTSTFNGAELYQTVLENVRISNTTTFGERCAYEDPDADIDVSEWGAKKPLEAAAWVYRRLEALHEDNAMADRARHYHFRKEEAQRQQHWGDRDFFSWLVSTANRYLLYHGESLKHIIGWSALVILGSALAYPFVGGITDGGQRYRIAELSQLFTPEGVVTFLRSLYFSTITFSTIGYANVSPAGAGSRVLVSVESLLGALLMALFVFVLGRRVAR